MYILFNRVDFGDGDITSMNMRVLSEIGSTIELQVGEKNALFKVKAKIPISKDWHIVKTALKDVPHGIHNIGLILKDSNKVEIDWIRFQ